ncbi:hypothetical protein JHN55_07015 [Streptomyces sp. MBT56]|uniref:hypothetical protein n=1 Tax=Streptomyces TaxID=1883 RepID=UPI00190B646C|nr:MULTISPECIES: hypothetical protein [unclassified Streptomyces]MBK3556289.1 hypothetical protein [Streptomyces sp. MBT56]MBK3601245.1 hypothetical protein [Streptomyces sp. MBT54]MBK3614519.1 hypothetical protein [Streptomyces sp. MBT98]MBK6042836.1 hypothetical protein [Streptomyces sp. MBT55]
MASLVDAAALRRLADALDRLAETATHTGVTFSSCGTQYIEIDDITLALECTRDGERVRYTVDLSGR